MTKHFTIMDPTPKTISTVNSSESYANDPPQYPTKFDVLTPFLMNEMQMLSWATNTIYCFLRALSDSDFQYIIEHCEHHPNRNQHLLNRNSHEGKFMRLLASFALETCRADGCQRTMALSIGNLVNLQQRYNPLTSAEDLTQEPWVEFSDDDDSYIVLACNNFVNSSWPRFISFFQNGMLSDNIRKSFFGVHVSEYSCPNCHIGLPSVSAETGIRIDRIGNEKAMLVYQNPRDAFRNLQLHYQSEIAASMELSLKMRPSYLLHNSFLRWCENDDIICSGAGCHSWYVSERLLFLNDLPETIVIDTQSFDMKNHAFEKRCFQIHETRDATPERKIDIIPEFADEIIELDREKLCLLANPDDSADDIVNQKVRYQISSMVFTRSEYRGYEMSDRGTICALRESAVEQDIEWKVIHADHTSTGLDSIPNHHFVSLVFFNRVS